MTPAERVVVEAAVRWRDAIEEGRSALGVSGDLLHAVESLLAERDGPQLETVEITWAQVVEGDQIYRSMNGAPVPAGSSAGVWYEVTAAGSLTGTDRVRVRARGIGKPIQPVADKPVTVKRGATGKAVDTLGSVLWSGANAPQVATLMAAIINEPVSDPVHDPEASEES